MAWTNEAPEELYVRKSKDPTDPRLGEWTQRLSLESEESIPPLADANAPAWFVLGYPDDEGIGMNGGRRGAKDAPDSIRSVFFKMTPSLLDPTPRMLVDAGNVSTDVPLAERHQRGREIIRKALATGYKTLSLGGGHDYGYADGAGFLDHCQTLKERPIILNIDAHLDVRPLDSGFTSGTPFRRLLTDYPGEFDFVEMGLRNHCNSAEHLRWAKSQGAKILLMEDIRAVGFMNLLQPLLATYEGRPAFLSIDIDGFALSEAPGCSQSWQGGITLDEFTPALRAIQKSLNVLTVGIYEVSPPLDVGNQTSKLAALLLHQTLFNS